ncbi:lysozyme inhibitor LprI family protein [Psychrobacillus sp. NPDC093180]|uniref:lysozyme inhibitor LprI family protein n=1 Tax=Psychrobacillus sp. NPDC093180 TaxID=3364489 RepID=UPI0037FA66D9
MKNNRKILIVMFTLVFTLLAGCVNASDESSDESNENSTPSTEENSATKDSTDKTESSSEGAGNTELNNQADTSTKTNDGQPLESSNSDSEITISNKDDYLKKLNEMEEADRYSEAGTTTIELVEQEAERYKKWDAELNKIYGVLKEQLSAEQMDKLRDDQRDWIKYRDEAAKEASLKYEGGSMEGLEYVATQAGLTRERCYLLVAKYMK